ncbi:hypothetical protein J2S49_000952 [Arcanobacterium wilhelmae]|uniref:Uncharacterized protein n=1 Tax=Arcanobacterium wilhelmae TaxID=1803177 RepID=A0ABT9NB04_9ACTO|nr:hypothetical protein [Arcanobacterium wilhelmae]MDP9800876.1 hypothetical protein [Arcanobacterium wilhelmae]WFN90243.1 hypothetical protein P8A24_08680 [Arcanobacterium wilhelmae]
MRNKKLWCVVVALCFMLATGCEKGGGTEPKVPDGWVKDQVDNLVEFAYPKDLENTPEVSTWANVHQAPSRLKGSSNYVMVKSDKMMRTLEMAQAQFLTDFSRYGVKDTHFTYPVIDGVKVDLWDIKVSADDVPGRVWFIPVSDKRVITVLAIFEESRKGDLDKVGKSIRILGGK